MDGLIVDPRFHGTHPEPAGFAHGLGVLGRRDHGLGGHAAGIQAVAAHVALFKQYDRLAKGCRCRRDGQPSRPCTDDADVGSNLLAHGSFQSDECQYCYL